MFKPLLCSTVAVVLFASAGTAAAQYAPTTYTPPAHDHRGFFGRIYLGPSYLSSSIEPDGADELTVSGGGATLGLAAGFSVSPNVAIYAEVLGNAVVGPDVEQGGLTGTASDNVSFGVAGLGIGAAYYFPSNFFVSGTLAITQITVDDDTDDDEDGTTTDSGPGVSLMAGKEWWVAQDIGLGVAAQLFLGSEPDHDDGPTWHTGAFGVAVTATYN